jgi:hypothetical protein
VPAISLDLATSSNQFISACPVGQIGGEESDDMLVHSLHAGCKCGMQEGIFGPLLSIALTFIIGPLKTKNDKIQPHVEARWSMIQQYPTHLRSSSPSLKHL